MLPARRIGNQSKQTGLPGNPTHPKPLYAALDASMRVLGTVYGTNFWRMSTGSKTDHRDRTERGDTNKARAPLEMAGLENLRTLANRESTI